MALVCATALPLVSMAASNAATPGKVAQCRDHVLLAAVDDLAGAHLAR